MTTVADIIAAFKALWDADGTLGAIPLCHGRVEDGSDAPYATIRVRSGVKEFNSRKSLEEYSVTLRAYGGPLVSDAGAVQAAMSTIYDKAKDISGITGFIMCFADEDDIEEDEFRKNATDVVVATGTWVVTLEQTRGP
jgi:hypothetical protein